MEHDEPLGNLQPPDDEDEIEEVVEDGEHAESGDGEGEADATSPAGARDAARQQQRSVRRRVEEAWSEAFALHAWGQDTAAELLPVGSLELFYAPRGLEQFLAAQSVEINLAGESIRPPHPLNLGCPVSGCFWKRWAVFILAQYKILFMRRPWLFFRRSTELPIIIIMFVQKRSTPRFD